MNGLDNKEWILKSLNASLKGKKLYPPGHPAATAPVKKAFDTLTECLTATNNLMISLLNEALMFEECPIENGERLYQDIIHCMNDKNVDVMIFEKGFTEKELSNIIDFLAGDAKFDGQELQNELHSRGVIRITLKTVPSGRMKLLEIYNGAVEVVKNVMGEVRMGKIPKSGPVNAIVDEVTESVLSDQNAIMGLTMIKNYDNYLYNHSVNVSVTSIALGRAMQFAKAELHVLGVGALLHDIGKTGVSEQIIRKPGGLSTEEWEKIKEHPVLGSNITKRMDGMDETVGRLILEHHIKYDYSGYPDTDSRLHPLSQIITVCDAYDALTTLRVYQKPYNPADAIKVMASLSGRHFNPDTLKAFINMMGIFPIGSMVRLSTNEIGVVIRVHRENSDSPVVKILYDRGGAQSEAPHEIDLTERKDLFIVSAVNPVMTNIDIGMFFEKESAV